MRSIDSEIQSGNFKRVYLLFGTEHYLMVSVRTKLLKALGATEENDMNFSRLDEKNFSVDALISDSDTLPFFADRRVILVNNSGFFKGNKKDKDKLVKYIPEIPETTVIIFVEDEVDKRDKLYKAVAKSGTAEEYKILTEEKLLQWIGIRLRKYGLNIRRDAWNEFYMRTGSSMDLMNEEFEKLSAYCMGKGYIEKSDVEAVCVNASETRIFALTDALAQRDTARVFRVYQDMLRQNEKAPGIFALIERQLMQLYQMKHLDYDHASMETKKKATGLSKDWTVNKLSGYARKFTEEELVHLLDCAEYYEESYKRSRMKDTVAVEMLMLEALKKPHLE